MRVELFLLLYNRHGKQGFRFAISDVVNLLQHIQSIFRHVYLFIFFPQRWPFDWRAPLGYLIPFFIQFTSLFFIIHGSGCNFMYDTSVRETLFTIAANIKDQVHSMNASSRFNRNSADLHKKLSAFIESHVKGIQLSQNLKNSFQRQYHFWHTSKKMHLIERCEKFLLINKYLFFRFVKQFSDTYEFYIMESFLWCLSTISVILVVVKVEMVEYYGP